MPQKKKTVGEIVRDRFFAVANQRRKEMKITLATLASKCGITKETIINMQKGRSPLRVDVMCNISVELRFDSGDIQYICSPMEFKPLNISLRR